MDRLKLWLKHFYVEGRTNYLIMLLGAVDLGDFINRVALIALLISQGIKDVNLAQGAIDEVKERTNQLSELEHGLQHQEAEVVKIMQQDEALHRSKELLLEQVRKELGENQGRVLEVVAGLAEALKPLETVLERFRNAPWDKYRPDRLQFTGKRVQAEYSQNTISRMLFGAVTETNATRVSFADSMLVISGFSKEQVQFTIAGELFVEGGNVCYRLKTVTIGEVALSPELVQIIGGRQGLVYPVDLLMGWKLENITVHQGGRFLNWYRHNKTLRWQGFIN
ncbi:hypothetical protein N752_17455 [Desulforamulus aquiferis]|nr:hypothetical protein [Desulforamulus aquiferis]RYD03868.1 hypothetical protein N752_17455 [Desulforamulus aquiferis]